MPIPSQLEEEKKKILLLRDKVLKSIKKEDISQTLNLKRKLERMKLRLAKNEGEIESLRGHDLFLRNWLKENKREIATLASRFEKALKENARLEYECQTLRNKRAPAADNQEERLKEHLKKTLDLLSARERQLATFQEYHKNSQKTQDTLKGLEIELGEKNKELDTLLERLKKNDAEVEEKRKHNEQLERAIQFLRERNEEAQLETKNLEEELLTSQSLLDEAKRLFKDREQEAAESEEEMQALRKQFSALKTCVFEANDAKVAIAKSVHEMAARLDEETKQREELSSLLEIQTKELEKSKDATAFLQNELIDKQKELESAQEEILDKIKGQEELSLQLSRLGMEKKGHENELSDLRRKLLDATGEAELAKQHLGKKVKESTLLAEAFEKNSREFKEMTIQLKEAENALRELQIKQEHYDDEKLEVERKIQEASTFEAECKAWEEKYKKIKESYLSLEEENKALKAQKEKYDKLQTLLASLGTPDLAEEKVEEAQNEGDPSPPKQTPYKNLFDYNQHKPKMKSNFFD